MENSVTDQRPDPQALLDGLIDSTGELMAPSTPTPDQEKPVTGVGEGRLVEPNSAIKFGDDCGLSEGGIEEETEKLRRTPVALSESESCGGADLLRKTSKEAEEEPASSVTGDAVRDSGQGLARFAQEEEQVNQTCQSSDKSTDKSLDAEANPKEKSSSQSVDNNKREASEIKRKNSRRSFKSEKDFLEFTLKYQQVIAERDAAIAVRDKLESLCRELQRQNKMLMDECKRVSTEGQNLRLDLSTKFQDAIKEVSNKLEEQKDESLSQLRENELLKSKLKQLADQYALSEQQYAQKLKQKSLELQIADLKIQQHEERLIQEQAQMKLYAEQVSQLLSTEKHLRLQLTADGDKFQQFQEALLKSNEVFETFKQEIEKLKKSIKELKKENTFLKSKCEKSDVTLIELVEEREHLKKQLEKARNQRAKLESLCRSLQAERKLNSNESNSFVPVTVEEQSSSGPVTV